MRVVYASALGLSTALLGSCGGGDSGGNDGTDTSLPTLTVTLSEAEQTVTVPEAGKVSFGFGASYTGSSSSTIIPDVIINAERYKLVGDPTSAAGKYTINLETVRYAPGGLSTSTIIFRLCADADCTRVYPGSTAAYTLNLDIKMKDWQTTSRLADHRGHLEVAYKKEDMVKKWEHAAATGSTIGRTAAARRRVFMTEKASDGKYYALALDSIDGTNEWRIDMGTDVLSDPAYADGKVYYTKTAASGTRTPMVVDAVTGAVTTLPAYDAPAGAMNQPVPFATSLHVMAGANGMIAYAYNLANRTIAWQQDVAGAIASGAAVAVDDTSVYAFTGPSIAVLSRATGAQTATIANTDFAGGSQWSSAPILDPAGRLYAFTRKKSFAEASPLAAFAIAGGTKLWQSTQTYLGGPVLGTDYLFAVNATARRVDAINPATGAIVYSITIPGTGTPTGHLVSTRSHLFVSTLSDVYAFNLASSTRAQEFTAAVGGSLAVTPDNQLIVANGTKVTSYRLW